MCIRKWILGFFGFLFILTAILILRTTWFAPSPQTLLPTPNLAVSTPEVAARLSQAIQFKTISRLVPGNSPKDQTSSVEPDEFHAFHEFLRKSFPLVHEKLHLEKVNTFSLLYLWKGRQQQAPSILLAAHQDVVPYSMYTIKDWLHPPFSGMLSDGYIWGRGTIDNKASLMAMFESVEWLLAQGFQPERDVYFAFGHDEEVGGMRGAAAIVETLRQQNVELSYVLDEGGFVLSDVVPGVDQPVAMIGIAEKGYLTVELNASGQTGHSSMPPKQTAAGVLSAGVARLEKQPMPLRYAGGTARLFEAVAIHMPFANKVLLSNLWLFEPVLLNILAGSASTNAAVRTTFAVTMLNAGVKDNVLPSSASATVNVRLLQGDKVADVLNYIADVIDDPRIAISVKSTPSEASPTASIESVGFEQVKTVAASIFHEDKAIVAPYLTINATDARHYAKLAKNAYRFTPLSLSKPDLSRIHGPNERISVDDYLKMIAFYRLLLAGGHPDPNLVSVGLGE